MGDFACSLCTEPWEDRASNGLCSLRILSLTQSCGSHGQEPVGFQSWGVLPLVSVFKVEVLDVESKFFTCQEEPAVWGSLQTAWHNIRSVFQHFLPILTGYFLICPVCRNHSASFWISFRGNCSMCSHELGASVERGASYFTILVDSSIFSSFSVFNFLRNLHTASHSSCTNSCSYQQY